MAEKNMLIGTKCYVIEKCLYAVEKHARRSRPFLCNKEMLLSDGEMRIGTDFFYIIKKMPVSGRKNYVERNMDFVYRTKDNSNQNKTKFV